MFHVPEQYRLKMRGMPSAPHILGNNGAFLIPTKIAPHKLNVIASDGDGWEHVSVSTPIRCPRWNEMCLIKSLFWDDSDLVVQFHPIESDYVNFHRYCLHLWRALDSNDFCMRPPPHLVGPKSR